MNYIYRVLDYMAWFWFMEWLILVYIINRIIHGRLEIWNLSSRVHVRYRCEHSKINSISPRDHVLFSIYSCDTIKTFASQTTLQLLQCHMSRHKKSCISKQRIHINDCLVSFFQTWNVLRKFETN